MDKTEATKQALMVSRLKNSDSAAFDSIYRLYAPRLFGFALNLLKDRADAEGIVQEVFLKVWQNREKIKLHTSFESYLFTITHNTVMSVLRKKLSEKKYIDYLHSIQMPVSEDAAIAELEWKDLQQEVNAIVANLPSRQRQVYELSRDKGMTYAEIAEFLGLSVNTVENHMGRALKFIRAHL
ncbi:MAG: RNA polymerase sigma-70 factor, partial [Lewinella sp.]|nr:RNA polymerase sigma-70 factor [Lewinella sp.]